MVPTAAIITGRLGVDDDVSAQTQLWTNAVCELGFAVRRITGEITADAASAATSADVTVPALASERRDGDERTAVNDVVCALDGCDLAIVENLCSVPERPYGAHVAATAVTAFAENGGRVVLHHHRLPWQPDWAQQPDGGLPSRVPGAVHVGVSLRARRDLHARGYEPAVAIHDHFDFDAPDADRRNARAAFGFADDEIVFFQPTRAARTTNVAGAVRYLQSLRGAVKNRPLRYWLRGPVDDEVAPTVDRLLERCPVPVTIGCGVPVRDALAACDVVLLPSTWDRSGGAAVQSVIARRPCVVGPFPVLGELQAVGLRFFDLDEPMELVKFLARPAQRLFDVNLRRARLSFSATDLAPKVADVLALAGVNV